MTLEQFVKRFLTGRIAWHDMPKFAITNFGDIISIVLYRKPPFQVEMFIIPNSNFSCYEHRHPNVDAWEFPLTGDGMLFINGKPIHNSDECQQWIEGKSKGIPFYIPSSDRHYLIGNTPFAFLSIQEWLNGVEPTSVGLDWDGEINTDEQAKLLESLSNG